MHEIAIEAKDAGYSSDIEVAAMRKVSLRILPIVVIGMFVSYIDRVNVGFAALEMNKDLHFTATDFGTGLAAFFFTLVVCSVPSNMVMKKLGARLWISTLMITWGIISGATAFIVGLKSFVLMRLLLGAAEAGFFSGVILYLTYWFPRAYRAKALSLFILALPLSSFIGSPISGALLGTEGWLGLHGWQWVFIIEALPAVILGIVALAWLPSRPQNARWLSARELNWLEAKLAAEKSAPAPVATNSVWRTMLHPRILALAFIYAGSLGAGNALSLWQPQIIKSFGLTNLQTGFLNAIPFGIAAVAMVLWAKRSDKTGERIWHTALPLLLSALGLIACMMLPNLTLTVIALIATLIGVYAGKAPMFALATESLSDGAAAIGIAQVSALGSIAGMVCPFLLGWIKDLAGSFSVALMPMVGLALTAAAVTFFIGRRPMIGDKRPPSVSLSDTRG
jgi:ACS family tartrate transporter-like MFS transporter